MKKRTLKFWVETALVAVNIIIFLSLGMMENFVLTIWSILFVALLLAIFLLNFHIITTYGRYYKHIGKTTD